MMSVCVCVWERGDENKGRCEWERGIDRERGDGVAHHLYECVTACVYI